MVLSLTNMLSAEDLAYLQEQGELHGSLTRFSVGVPESLRQRLEAAFGISLTGRGVLPMRWVRGDTRPHMDTGSNAFEQTYLVYVSGGSGGSLLIDGSGYPIEANRGYSFREGVEHETVGTGSEPRLLLGPFNEQGLEVGAVFAVSYYTSYTDASNAYESNYNSGGSFPDLSNGVIAVGNSYNVGTIIDGSLNGITNWRVIDSTGVLYPSSYLNGTDLSNSYNYYLFPAAPCFLQGTRILCLVDGQESHLPVEQLEPGTLVRTSRDGYKPVSLVGHAPFYNPGTDERSQDRLYKLSPTFYPELDSDLFITGCHAVLVDSLTALQREDGLRLQGETFITDGKVRLMACIDDRAEPWVNQGQHTVWHFALEHEDPYMNYGVYANGLLVETCSLSFLRDYSNMIHKDGKQV
jgi:hypothetical protein